jgi:outer membrane protein assembly factor BamB
LQKTTIIHRAVSTIRHGARSRAVGKMRSFEIFFGPPALPSAPLANDHAEPASGVRRATSLGRRRVREVLDVFVEGANVTARIAESHASCILRDLGLSLAQLARTPRGKAIVRFYDEAWEMAVERIGARAILSVYRGGQDPQVSVHDRTVLFEEVIDSARDAIAAALACGAAPHKGIELELREAEAALTAIDRRALCQDCDGPEIAVVSVEPERDAPIAFSAEFSMRLGAADGSPGAHPRAQLRDDAMVERADLHALLFRGRVRAEIRGRAVDLGEGHPFLFLERLVELARRALEAWERGRAMNVRSEGGGLVVGLRVSPEGDAALGLAGATFPALSVPDIVEAALAFGRALVRAIVRRDRAQHGNLRLSALRRQLRETADHLREARQEDALINPTPEPYRAFAAHARTRSEPPGAATRNAPPAGRLRYQARWRAIVPQIDLRATFLCGDRLVVGAAQETFCLDRASGEVLWRAHTERATCVVTPGGIARLEPNGQLSVHDFGNGEVMVRTQLAPRLGGPAAGAVVHVQGLPRLLVVTEGERHLVAVDLASGEPRWRFPWTSASKSHAALGMRGALRMKRAGKLLYFASGDSAMTALDVLTGSVIWRLRDRLRFQAAPTLDHDALFAVAGGVHCAARLYAVDAFSGRPRWTRHLEDGSTSSTIEGSPLVAALPGGAGGGGAVVVVATRDRHGLRLSAYDRDTGAPRWASDGAVAPIGTSWLAVDDLLIGNTPIGDLVAYSADGGELRYRHVLGRSLEADTPRRLEPVLRSGALFVPHTDVHVFRPSDGAPLGSIAPCEAIPDLLRVDERCDVYVAEESGHLACFAAGPRLVLVK